MTCLVPGLLRPRFQGYPAFGCRPPISLPHPYVPCAAESQPRPSGACLPSGTSCPHPQHCSSPHRSMANLSVLFGQVSGRVGWLPDRAGVPSPVCCGGVLGRGDTIPARCVGVQGMLLSLPSIPLDPTPPSMQTNPPPQVVRGLSAGARVFEYMTLSPCIPLSGGSCIPREDLRGSITFHNVSFRSVSAGEHRGPSLQAEDRRGAGWGPGPMSPLE